MTENPTPSAKVTREASNSPRWTSPWFCLAAALSAIFLVFYVPLARCGHCAGTGYPTEDEGLRRLAAIRGGELHQPCGECSGRGRLTVADILSHTAPERSLTEPTPTVPQTIQDDSLLKCERCYVSWDSKTDSFVGSVLVCNIGKEEVSSELIRLVCLNHERTVGAETIERVDSLLPGHKKQLIVSLRLTDVLLMPITREESLGWRLEVFIKGQLAGSGEVNFSSLEDWFNLTSQKRPQ